MLYFKFGICFSVSCSFRMLYCVPCILQRIREYVHNHNHTPVQSAITIGHLDGDGGYNMDGME